MDSSIPLEVIDDDEDEFDWEAAVKAIDVACQGEPASTSRPEGFAHSIPSDGIVKRGHDDALPDDIRPKLRNSSSARQSTLDKFVGAFHRRSLPRSRSMNHTVHEDNVVEEAVCGVNIDLEAAKTWIYPVNVPLRDYQLSITKTALFTNTMVALPTGLGKTLIAAVVMYNYFRWFPEGKIVFSAPSRPLVMQQIEACHNIVGISQEWTIDMTGLTSPSKRSCFWKTKRVFFVTPQVFEKDIQSGICLVNHLVCLVIDEAHRALGNYSYCVAVRELMAVPVQLRILALTATPGSKQQTIQKVIDNLHISTLEYRNESDHDVSPYVHNRKLELIEVAMGKDATEINNLLLEAIRPFVARLCANGVLPNRDFLTLSPCELLNSRDRFRQAPPLALPHTKYGEVEGYFGVLITLYHIRKLLSSHGIRPAYEMLEEKLQHGSFARLMSKNEAIWKVKLLMERSLSHGAPNPKLSKMIEILTDHFKMNDPKNSRVIIFSNFRGSVRDIMDSLSKIGEFVKATQFIGQSSGKALKGQTQKVQQAVLQKFRAGGYNVIVATSIGEEGLDIMEVDLVICFDANISPLRMIQRMGRTGRKHDGRVVVLACEGPELKGYSRKQANSKAVRKHMRNGGMNSFDFHSSPRMIPHICKPEVQFVELSIEQFVPRGRKVKDDPLHRSSLTEKISDAENELISKYFCASKEGTWRPSLIAFPNFQAFPSTVHKVMHSFRTGVLIDTMQHLQGLYFLKDSKTILDEDGVSSSQCLEAEIVVQHDKSRKDSISIHVSPEAHLQREISDLESSRTRISRSKEDHCVPDVPCETPLHCFLYEANFVSIDALGRVLIASVPSLPLVRGASPCKNTTSDTKKLLISMKQDSCRSRRSAGEYDELNMQAEVNLINSAGSRCLNQEYELNSSLCNFNAIQKPAFHGVEKIVLQTPIADKILAENSEETAVVTPSDARKKTSTLLANESTSDFREMELSPRLTNLMERGVVPESPIGEIGHSSHPKENMVCTSFSSNNEYCGLPPKCPPDLEENKIHKDKSLKSAELSNCDGRNDSLDPAYVSPPKLCTGLSSRSLHPEENEKVKMDNIASTRGRVSASPINDEIQTPLLQMKSSTNERGYLSGSPANEEIHTPLVNVSNSSCSKDWHMSSGEASKTVQQTHKFKRLCKFGDFGKRMHSKTMKKSYGGPVKNLSRSFICGRSSPMKHTRGKQKDLAIHVRDFIEEEAEVSSEAEASDDEEDDRDNSSYDDSFIDDRVSPTSGSTQAEPNGGDMMAIYRRSLLSQSPMDIQPNCLTDFSPDSRPPAIPAESGSCSSGKICYSLQTPQTVLHSGNQSTGRNSISCQMDPEKISSVIMPGETSSIPNEEERKMESRKRKLSFPQVGSVPATFLHEEGLFQSLTRGKASLRGPAENNDLKNDEFYDDQFYYGLDLDAMEAQAAKLLQFKSEMPMEQKQMVNPNSFIEENNGLNSPSFDLGI